MAARKATSTTATTAVPTVRIDNDQFVAGLLDAADKYSDRVKQSMRGVVIDRIAIAVEANATYKPLYDVMLAEVRSVNGSDAKLLISDFAGRLTERGKVLRSNSEYVFPIPTRDLNTYLSWRKDLNYDADDADSVVAHYDNMCSKQGREHSWGGFLLYLGEYTDADGNQWTPEGDRSARGQELDKQAEANADAMADVQWCAFNFKVNFEGMTPAAIVAWCDAAMHDLKAIRARTAKDAKIKTDGAKLLKSNVDAGQQIGGDKITKQIAAAQLRAEATVS